MPDSYFRSPVEGRVAVRAPVSVPLSVRISPERAIAIGLSLLPAGATGRVVAEGGAEVAVILLALRRAGYDIVER